MAVDLQPTPGRPTGAVEAVERTLDRAAAGVALNAFITLAPERARDAARAVDGAAAARGPGFHLAGWTIAVKDLIDSARLVTAAGSSRTTVARRDAVVLRNL